MIDEHRESLSTDEPDPRLDELLGESSPPTLLADRATTADLTEIVALARAEAAPDARKPIARRSIGIATALVIGIAGAGVGAAALTRSGWAPWLEDPDVMFTYTLPSGATCEQRIGGIEGADPVEVAAVRDFFRTHDVMSMVDMDAEIALFRSGTNVHVNEDGFAEPVGPGSADYPSPDSEYGVVLSQAVGLLVFSELEANGTARDDPGVMLQGQTECPDAQW